MRRDGGDHGIGGAVWRAMRAHEAWGTSRCVAGGGAPIAVSVGDDDREPRGRAGGRFTTLAVISW